MYYFLRTILWALILVIRTLKDKEIQANSVLKLSLSQVVGNTVHWAPLQYFLNLSSTKPVGILDSGLWGKLFGHLLPPVYKYICGKHFREFIFLFNWLEMVIDFYIFFHDCFMWYTKVISSIKHHQKSFILDSFLNYCVTASCFLLYPFFGLTALKKFFQQWKYSKRRSENFPHPAYIPVSFCSLFWHPHFC